MKASYLYCLAAQVRWMVIGARNEALSRQYRRLGFFDLLGDNRTVILHHAARLPHSVLAFDVTTAESAWRAASHPLYTFMVETVHPSIQLFSTRPALPPRPARTPRDAPAWSLPAMSEAPAASPDPSLQCFLSLSPSPPGGLYVRRDRRGSRAREPWQDHLTKLLCRERLAERVVHSSIDRALAAVVIDDR